MSYTSNLSKEEKIILCNMITGTKFKELFKSNEKEFSKILTGFRAKTLPEQQALKTAVSNVDKPFIEGFINLMVDSWLEEISENINMLEKMGLSHDDALAETLIDSLFRENVELYLKLAGIDLDDLARIDLSNRMKYVEAVRVKESEFSEKLKSIEEENRRLLIQLDEGKKDLDDIKAEYEQKLSEIEDEKGVLASSLFEVRKKIAELQAAPVAADSKDNLKLFDDTYLSALPPYGGKEIYSLCEVISDYQGQKWLMRYADLSPNGQYTVFIKDENNPTNFTNRDRIFYKDGPSEVGFFGIWNWDTIPNENDPSKDYVISKYNTEIDAIEIVIMKGISDIDDLVKHIKTGVAFQLHSAKTMFAFSISKGKYSGLLCREKELCALNGKKTISDDCIELPVYDFSANDIMYLDNGIAFYKNAFTGIPSSTYRLKNPLEIVKRVVMSSISWSAYKSRNITRSEYRKFKDYLEGVPANNILDEIKELCRCSEPEAESLLKEFINKAYLYLDGDSIEDEMIISAVLASEELRQRTNELIRKDWEEENRELIEDAENKRSLIKTEVKNFEDNLNKSKKEYEKIKAEEERISEIIKEKEKLAKDVEKEVSERIKKAQERVAEFIAGMAFVNGSKNIEFPEKLALRDPDEASAYRYFARYDDLGNFEEHHSWKDVVETVAFELGEAGVSESYKMGLSAFLCAAFIEKESIILVGPNALDITQAFCSALTANKHGELCCEGSFSDKKTEKIGFNGENIVVIKNLFSSRWINDLPEILIQKDMFYIATHPYPEDIQSEPQSLFGFMLPLFTEFFADKKASGKYVGGYFAEDFEPYIASKKDRRDLKILAKLPVSALIRNKINSVITAMHDIYPDTNADDEFLFGILPMAYATLSVKELSDYISDPHNGFTISKELRKDLRHILGDTE